MADVEHALTHVQRADFLPDGGREQAGDDAPVPIGKGQTNSQPSTVRRMLELLDVEDSNRVLDVGAGSGWTTALLCQLVGPDGYVLGLELEPDIAAWGAQNLVKYGGCHTRLEPANPHILGAPETGPWDRILVSAAVAALPEALVEQLSPNGVLVIPVDGELTRVQLQGGKRCTSVHGPYRFVPLRGSWKT